MKQCLSTLVLLAAASASAASVTVNLNGKAVTLTTTTIGGVSYVRTADLQRALTGGRTPVAVAAAGNANNAAGGANQKASVEGCMNEWLFNGIVRMRVTKAEVTYQDKGDAYPGYAITTEFKNGTNETLRLDDVGMHYDNALSVTFANGDSWSDGRGGGWQDKTYAKLMQGGGTVYQFRMYTEQRWSKDQPVPPPQKFLIEVKNKVSDSVKSRFTVSDPSFRVDLTCTK